MSDNVETWCPVPGDGDFECLWRVEADLQKRGFSIGALQGDSPRGIMTAEYDVAKWRNLGKKDRAGLVGVMTFAGRPRNPAAIVVTWAKRDERETVAP